MDSSTPQSSTLLRRKFLVERLQEDGEVSWEQIKKWHEGKEGKLSAQSIETDIEYLGTLLSMNIKRSMNGKYGSTWKNISITTESTKEARAKYFAKEKAAIANYAACLALAGRDLSCSRNVTNDEVNKVFLADTKSLSCSTNPNDLLKEVGDQIDSEYFPKDGNGANLVERIETVWRYGTRRVAIDNGTTNDLLAGIIADAVLPSEKSSLSYLEVLTNGRGIFYELGKQTVKAHCLITGGSQKTRSEALCSDYTKAFFEYVDIRCGFSFIGATAIDLGKYTAGSDQREDGIIKSVMLERGSIRCIVADHSKFMDDHYKAHYTFTALSRQTVDILITDKVPNDESNRKARSMMDEAKKELNKRGVVLLEASIITEESAEQGQKSTEQDQA